MPSTIGQNLKPFTGKSGLYFYTAGVYYVNCRAHRLPTFILKTASVAQSVRAFASHGEGCVQIPAATDVTR